MIVDDQYYTFSSVFFYTNQRALLLNGRVNNLEYGSYAPGAPHVFIGDEDFVARWRSGERYYLVIEKPRLARLEKLSELFQSYPLSWHQPNEFRKVFNAN